jgi:hypothetical protein
VAAVAALLALAGFGAWLGVDSSNAAGPAAALTDTAPTPEPPPTTTPAPAPDPAPAPQPAPKPAPKPVVHSAVVHSARSTPAPATPTPTYTPPSTPSYTPSTVHPHPAVHHKRKKPKRHIRHRAAAPKPKTTTGQTLAEQAVRVAPVAVVSTANRNKVEPLIIALICASFLLFGVGATPARHVPWRRAAYVLEERHLEFTLFGVAFLAIAVFAILLTRGL